MNPLDNKTEALNNNLPADNDKQSCKGEASNNSIPSFNSKVEISRSPKPA
jgi:hypothetical protein